MTATPNCDCVHCQNTRERTHLRTENAQLTARCESLQRQVLDLAARVERAETDADRAGHRAADAESALSALIVACDAEKACVSFRPEDCSGEHCDCPWRPRKVAA